MTPETVLYIKMAMMGVVAGLILGIILYNLKKAIENHLTAKRIKKQEGKIKFIIDGKKVDMATYIPVKVKKVKKKKEEKNKNLVKDFVEEQKEVGNENIKETN